MNSYKVLLGVTIIFVCLGVFLTYAGISYSGATYQTVPTIDEGEEQDRGWLAEKWEGFCRQFWGGTIGQMINPEEGEGIGFLWDMATFSVEGLPSVFSWIFWILTTFFVIAVTRVVVGLVTGGGG